MEKVHSHIVFFQAGVFMIVGQTNDLVVQLHLEVLN